MYRRRKRTGDGSAPQTSLSRVISGLRSRNPPGRPSNSAEHEQAMADEHPLERLLRDVKEKDDLKAADYGGRATQSARSARKVRLQWVRTKAQLIEEIGRANAVLERHWPARALHVPRAAGAGSGNIARCNLALAYPAKSPRAEYDLTVLSADGRMILLHRATAQRHQKLTVSRHPARLGNDLRRPL